MSRRILVVDDNESVRKSFRMALEFTDYEVDTVESGEKGIEMARDTKYDLIYLDLNMPGLDGVETMRKLKETMSDVPFYIVTAFHEEYTDRLKEAEEEGIVFQILRKPIGIEQILRYTKIIMEGMNGN
jgi:CheY-like chemotaxis protein